MTSFSGFVRMPSIEYGIKQVVDHLTADNNNNNFLPTLSTYPCQEMCALEAAPADFS